MRLITAHKILIGTATLFFFFFALWELYNYSTSGESWAIGRSILYVVIAVGFGIYLKNLPRLYKLR